MNCKTSTTSDINNSWDSIDFISAEKYIKKLQNRISVAYHNRDYKLMTYLQHQLIHSFYAKALAVKSVMSNKGHKTAGVDGVVWDKSKESSDRYNAIFTLNQRGYKPMPLNRTYRTKSNGKKRPLGIPTIKDRAMQTLYKYALEPIAESTADDNSFAYRKNRSAKDAVDRVLSILCHYPNYNYALKVDICSCFDSISHEWLLNNIPFDKDILMSFLKCGYIDKGRYYKTDCGIPQGGCLSSVLCNMTLDGIDELMRQCFNNDVAYIRYADDMIFFAEDEFILVQDVLPVLKEFLGQRNLELSEEKTQRVSIHKGFDFLGFHIQVDSTNNIICEPSKRKREKYLKSLIVTIKENSNLSTKELYKKLCPKIRGWCNYYKGAVFVHYLADIEFDTVMLINSLTNNTTLAGMISKKIFSRYFSSI